MLPNKAQRRDGELHCQLERCWCCAWSWDNDQSLPLLSRDIILHRRLEDLNFVTPTWVPRYLCFEIARSNFVCLTLSELSVVVIRQAVFIYMNAALNRSLMMFAFHRLSCLLLLRQSVHTQVVIISVKGEAAGEHERSLGKVSFWWCCTCHHF